MLDSAAHTPMWAAFSCVLRVALAAWPQQAILNVRQRVALSSAADRESKYVSIAR